MILRKNIYKRSNFTIKKKTHTYQTIYFGRKTMQTTGNENNKKGVDPAQRYDTYLRKAKIFYI